MSEADMISNQSAPLTVDNLVRDLCAIGLKEGDRVIVHSSLNKIGWACGGPVAVIHALQQVLTPDGALVMPTLSTHLTEPSHWKNPPVPESWWQTIRDHMPAYDPDTTPTRSMGLIPETFRKFPGVMRSSHPACSFAAWGKDAQEITREHQLDDPCGMRTPLGWLYENGGKVLLIGVGYDRNTSLHLAESMIEDAPLCDQGSPMIINGKREWVTYTNTGYDGECFIELGEAFEAAQSVEPCTIGNAPSRLINQRELVDFALSWMRSNPEKL